MRKDVDFRDEQVDVLCSVYPYVPTSSNAGILIRNHNTAYSWNCTYANLLRTLTEGFNVVTPRTGATRGSLQLFRKDLRFQGFLTFESMMALSYEQKEFATWGGSAACASTSGAIIAIRKHVTCLWVAELQRGRDYSITWQMSLYKVDTISEGEVTFLLKQRA